MASKQCQRLADLSMGHCFPPRPNISASTNVFINRRGSHRVGDVWPTHCCGDACHSSVSVAGSKTVYVNGRQQMRITDLLSCGELAGPGSPNVYAGG